MFYWVGMNLNKFGGISCHCSFWRFNVTVLAWHSTGLVQIPLVKGLVVTLDGEAGYAKGQRQNNQEGKPWEPPLPPHSRTPGSCSFGFSCSRVGLGVLPSSCLPLETLPSLPFLPFPPSLSNLFASLSSLPPLYSVDHPLKACSFFHEWPCHGSFPWAFLNK